MFKHQKQTSPNPDFEWHSVLEASAKLHQPQGSNNFQNPGLCLAVANCKPEDSSETNTNLMTPVEASKPAKEKVTNYNPVEGNPQATASGHGKEKASPRMHCCYKLILCIPLALPLCSIPVPSSHSF